MSRRPIPRASRHRIVPVWREEIDREAFARALLLLVMHLDEKEKVAHKQLEKNKHREGESDETG